MNCGCFCCIKLVFQNNFLMFLLGQQERGKAKVQLVFIYFQSLLSVIYYLRYCCFFVFPESGHSLQCLFNISIYSIRLRDLNLQYEMLVKFLQSVKQKFLFCLRRTAFYGESVRNILMSLFCKYLIFLSMPDENCITVSYSEYWFSGLQRLRERSRVITLLEGIKKYKV